MLATPNLNNVLRCCNMFSLGLFSVYLIWAIMVRSFHVVEIVGTTCELVGTSRVCFNHVVPSRACACTYVQRDASRHCNALRNCTFICCDVQY